MELVEGSKNENELLCNSTRQASGRNNCWIVNIFRNKILDKLIGRNLFVRVETGRMLSHVFSVLLRSG